MNKRKLLAAGALAASTVVIAALIAGLWPWQSAAAQEGTKQEAGKASVRWEYCELAGDHSGKCAFGSAKELIRGDSWEDLAKKMKAPVKGDTSEQSIRLAIFDHLGSQGWELATHTTFTMNGAFVSAKTFKRRL